MLAGGGEDLAQGLPEAKRAVADREHRGPHAAARAVTQEGGPGFGRSAVAVSHGHQLFGAVGADADHDQNGGLGLFQADPQVDAVDPDVHVVGAGQIAVLECGVVCLPLGGQPGDGRRRQAAVEPRNCSSAGTKSPVDRPCR